jgi:uncharacterized damage-inducible protein DinB
MSIERYRRWFEYEQDAHRKTLGSLRTVPADRRDSAEWQKACSLFAHLFAARRVWRARLGEPVTEPTDFFPAELTLEELETMAETEQHGWSNYLEQADDDELARIYDYRRSDGVPFRNSVEDTLTHMFAHSFYHRGQIAALVRVMGGEPAATDFIFWARDAIDVTRT